MQLLASLSANLIRMRVLTPEVASPQAPTSASASAMSPGLIVLILAVSLGIQPVTSDLYLPALPALKASFNATTSQAQLTLSTLLLAFGISQLIWGPLSDRYGRRPILLWGLSAYTLASFGCTLAASMPQLIAWRVVQGAAMGAVVMCASAIVRDLYQPQDGARIMPKGLSGLGLMALICTSYIAGTFLCRRLLAHYSISKSVAIGSLLNLAGGTLMGLLAWAEVQTVWAVMVPMAMYMLGRGVQQPCGQAGSVGPFPKAAGAASALNVFFMMLVAFVLGSWLGQHMDNALHAMAYSVWFCGAIIAISAWTLVRKYGEPIRP